MAREAMEAAHATRKEILGADHGIGERGGGRKKINKKYDGSRRSHGVPFTSMLQSLSQY